MQPGICFSFSWSLSAPRFTGSGRDELCGLIWNSSTMWGCTAVGQLLRTRSGTARLKKKRVCQHTVVEPSSCSRTFEMQTETSPWWQFSRGSRMSA
jgi:hypothetical protein